MVGQTAVTVDNHVLTLVHICLVWFPLSYFSNTNSLFIISGGPIVTCNKISGGSKLK